MVCMLLRIVLTYEKDVSCDDHGLHYFADSKAKFTKLPIFVIQLLGIPHSVYLYTFGTTPTAQWFVGVSNLNKMHKVVKLRHCLDRILHIRNNSSVKMKEKNMNNAFSLSKQDLKTQSHNLSKVNLKLFDRQCFSHSRPICFTQVIDFKPQPIKQKKMLETDCI